jgi:hypothetical protein
MAAVAASDTIGFRETIDVSGFVLARRWTMMTTSLHGRGRKLLAATLAAAVLLPVSSAEAWWGPGGPAAWAWDPQEAFLEEYGYLDRYGPTIGDIRRMHRDSWRAARGYPVRIANVGPYGPTRGDIKRQHHRKMRRMWGYPY